MYRSSLGTGLGLGLGLGLGPGLSLGLGLALALLLEKRILRLCSKKEKTIFFVPEMKRDEER